MCARHNVSEQTFYGGMQVDELRQARALAEENARLKRIVADMAVQIDILKAVNAKKWRARPAGAGRHSMRWTAAWAGSRRPAAPWTCLVQATTGSASQARAAGGSAAALWL